MVHAILLLAWNKYLKTINLCAVKIDTKTNYIIQCFLTSIVDIVYLCVVYQKKNKESEFQLTEDYGMLIGYFAIFDPSFAEIFI